MIKLTKNETNVYTAIQTATTAEDIAVITEMKKAAVLGVLVSLMKKGVAQSVENDGVKVFFQDLTHEVELFQEEVEQKQEEAVTEQVQEEMKEETPELPKDEEHKEELDPNLFTKNGKPRKVTNAMKIREQIALVKASMTKEDAINHVIMFGMETLGQSKALARAYVTENYDKVKV